MSTVVTENPSIDALLELVDRLAADLAGSTFQAGPAGLQDSVDDLIVADEIVGCSLELESGAVIAVMASVPGLEQLSGTSELLPAADALVLRLTAIVEEGGHTVVSASPISELTEVPGGMTPVDGLRALAGAGIFDTETPVASVGVCGSIVEAPAGAPEVRSPAIASGASRNIHLLADVTLAVTAQLGSTTMTMGGLLDLQPGGVIELDREAGSPIDLLVNGTLIARGEVVVSDGRYAVRVTEVVAEDEQR